MNFHQWDLMIVTPTLIVNLLVANGVLFDNEEIQEGRKKEIAKEINDKIATNLETLVRSLISFRDTRSSQLAAAVVYQSRKEQFAEDLNPPEAWTNEL